jgi:hypothetical protein
VPPPPWTIPARSRGAPCPSGHPRPPPGPGAPSEPGLPAGPGIPPEVVHLVGDDPGHAAFYLQDVPGPGRVPVSDLQDLVTLHHAEDPGEGEAALEIF